MKKIMLALCVVLGMVIGMAVAAQADAISGGVWYEFGFGGTGSYGVAGAGFVPGTGTVFAPNPAWTFTSSSAVSLNVTDLFLHGDQFAVYDTGVLIGATSSVIADSAGTTIDPRLAITDPLYSSGSFDLAAGSHSITLEAITSPYGGGAAAFEVPEPSMLLLFGGSLLGIATLRWRFKK